MKAQAFVLSLCVFLISPCATAENTTPPLGRLFFTAQERNRLDLERQQTGISPIDTDHAAGLADGEVRPSSGSLTRWPSDKRETSQVKHRISNRRSASTASIKYQATGPVP